MSDHPPAPQGKFESFAAFYAFYLAQHRKRSTRRLHFIGTTLALACLFLLALTGDPAWFFAALISGYGFAWAAHSLFEKNQPATFTHPVYSLLGDLRMWFEMLTGRIRF